VGCHRVEQDADAADDGDDIDDDDPEEAGVRGKVEYSPVHAL